MLFGWFWAGLECSTTPLAPPQQIFRFRIINVHQVYRLALPLHPKVSVVGVWRDWKVVVGRPIGKRALGTTPFACTAGGGAGTPGGARSWALLPGTLPILFICPPFNSGPSHILFLFLFAF